jgi:hypothetical protein
MNSGPAPTWPLIHPVLSTHAHCLTLCTRHRPPLTPGQDLHKLPTLRWPGVARVQERSAWPRRAGGHAVAHVHSFPYSLPCSLYPLLSSCDASRCSRRRGAVPRRCNCRHACARCCGAFKGCAPLCPSSRPEATPAHRQRAGHPSRVRLENVSRLVRTVWCVELFFSGRQS